MKIIALVKQILDPAGISVRRDKERVFINKEEYIVGPGSKAAIEAALRLKCEGEEHTVVALSLGRRQADDALREALAMGCDSAVLVADEALKDADTAVAVRALAAAVQKLGGADLIIAGRASGDTGTGQVGPRLAEALGYARITDVYALAAQDGTLQATRRWGQGYAALEAPLPAVVAVAPEAFPPRFPHGARIMNAYRQWEVITWSVADLELGEEDLKPVLSMRGETFPPPLETEVLRGDASTVAADAVMALRLQKLIGA
ncbi:MAG: electron transfer flavoprotein subunit beta [Chloroflexi bacterium]|nr:MAG: electron transfer flavoprotein subunit beta [Chloroflexota bacterium]